MAQVKEEQASPVEQAVAVNEAGVKSARRAIEVLEAIADLGGWVSLAELHVHTRLPRSSLHGLLRTLHESGWLESDPGPARYRLGVRALVCGTAYLEGDEVVRRATETLEKIRSETGFTAHFARRYGADVVYLETRESRRASHFVSRVGRTLPTYATALGKALLSELTDAEIEDLLPRELPPLNDRTIIRRDVLLEECARTRDRGYAIDLEEGTIGVRCVASVVPYRIPATDAISCSVPVEEMDVAGLTQLGEHVLNAAAELGRQLRMAGIR